MNSRSVWKWCVPMNNQANNLERDVLSIRDLGRVVFRTATGYTVDAASATNAEFDDWARARVVVLGHADREWTPAQRASFCDGLYRLGALTLATPQLMEELKSDATDDTVETKDAEGEQGKETTNGRA